MATLRAYGTPGERAQQTQFWAQYYPGQQRANAQFDLSAWSAAQDAQYRQDQADAAADQQDFANRVNLSRFSIGLDDSAQRLAEDRRRFDVNTGLAEKQIGAYGDARTQDRDARADARAGDRAEKAWATLQSNISGRKVLNLDEALAYLPEKTPENVARVAKMLDSANKEFTQSVLADYDTATAGVQADQLAAIIKTKGAAITEKDKEAAMWLDPQTLALIPRTVGEVIPGARWDYEKKKWTLEPDPDQISNLGELRRRDDNLGLSRFAPALTPALTPTSDTRRALRPGSPMSAMFANQRPPEFYGGNSRVNLSQFGTATNAPVVLQPSAPRRYPPAFYDRVNQLIASGLDPRAAKARAVQEFSR